MRRERVAGPIAIAALVAGIAGCPDTELSPLFPPVDGGLVVEPTDGVTCTPAEVEAFREASAPGVRTDLWVLFIDVGQGDSVWIRTPGESGIDAREILIDTGARELTTLPNPDGYHAIEKVMTESGWPVGSRIDTLVVTHPDFDHYGGAEQVLARYQVRSYIDPGWRAPGDPEWPNSKKTYADLVDNVQQRAATDPDFDLRMPVAEVGLGATEWGRGARVALRSADPNAIDSNDASIVLQLEYQGRRFLFLGDSEHAVEQSLLDRGDLHADVLQAGHHGSRTSTSQTLLDAVFPTAAPDPERYAVISSGLRFGHPHPEVIDRLGTQLGDIGHIFRTDRSDEEAGKSALDAPGDDHVLVRVTDTGELRVCYLYTDAFDATTR